MNEFTCSEHSVHWKSTREIRSIKVMITLCGYPVCGLNTGRGDRSNLLPSKLSYIDIGEKKYEWISGVTRGRGWGRGRNATLLGAAF